MKIVLDLQACQGTNKNRGIGRYSRSLALEIIKNKKKHDIYVLLNGFYSTSSHELTEFFSPYIQAEKIKIWYGVYPCDNRQKKNRRISSLLREKVIESLAPDVVHIFSVFEGYEENIITSINPDRKYDVGIILFDLIPLLNPDFYLKKKSIRNFYFEKLEDVKKADLIFTISDSVQKEALENLSVSEDKILSISSAVESDFGQFVTIEIEKKYLFDKCGIHKKFIFYCGGEDPRKNQETLIAAFAKLPNELRNEYQLVVACNMSETYKKKLHSLSVLYGLQAGDVIFTGYVSDIELKYLYKFCSLFVFPSLHEGFGLPLLEAMHTGSVCIASNVSSMPEVLDFSDALFDPKNEKSLGDKIYYALTNDGFRTSFRRHAEKQIKRFSWTQSSQKLLHAFEKMYQTPETVVKNEKKIKPRLAYVSPLPPLHSGIANYSADLLEELSRYYDLELIVDQRQVSIDWEKAHCTKKNVHNVKWLLKNQHMMDRILYHMGNSPFHTYMYQLFFHVPGILVLHDFFISNFLDELENTEKISKIFYKELFYSHSYVALQANSVSRKIAIKNYPCSLRLLEYAKKIIVHSKSSVELGNSFFSSSVSEKCAVIPLLRKHLDLLPVQKIRGELGFTDSKILISSFGVLGDYKGNKELLLAFANSRLLRNANCKLIFVADKKTSYGKGLLQLVEEYSLHDVVTFTGWVSDEDLKKYLSITDIAVQLRTISRGETSAAVLDCMNAGIATICNAIGSFAEIPDDCICMLPGKFSPADLQELLERLVLDNEYRKSLGERAQGYVRSIHTPSLCAQKYYEEIEKVYVDKDSVRTFFSDMRSNRHAFNKTDCKNTAVALARNFPLKTLVKTIFVDITWLVRVDNYTGIQRVNRSILVELLKEPPYGYRVEPVYARDETRQYYYARKFASQILGFKFQEPQDKPITYQKDDIFLGLDLFHGVSEYVDYFSDMRCTGVTIKFVVFDLIPVLFPDMFVAAGITLHTNWLKTIARFDGVICISNSVKDELKQWYESNGIKTNEGFSYDYFHLGQDFENSLPTKGLPEDIQTTLERIKARPIVLMVSTIEPRKGHAQVLSAMDILWQKNIEINLVLVGVQGWNVEQFADRLRNHEENGNRLFWLSGISDEYLELVYKASTVVLMASIAEGFGLALIEAAHYNKPLIIRDIPVFREIAGTHAYYFTGMDAVNLAESIENWLGLFSKNIHPITSGMKTLSWKESTTGLLRVLL